MTDVPTRVAKVLNEMYGTCMVAEQIEPVLNRLEQEGLLVVDAFDLLTDSASMHLRCSSADVGEG